MVNGNEKTAVLNEMIDQLKRLTDALEDIRDNDIPEATSLKDHSVKTGFFKRICYNSKWDDDEAEALEKIRTKYAMAIPTRNWQEDLFCVIFGLPRTVASTGKIPSDVNVTIPNALERLTEREKDVILYLHRDKLTFADISEKIGVSRERVRQIEGKALRKLRHKNVMAYLYCGEDYYISQRALYDRFENDEEIKQRRETLRKLNEEISSKLKQVERLRRIQECAERGESIKNLVSTGPLDIDSWSPIEYMELSVRSFNCLARRGIKTVGDLTALTNEELLSTHNLGVASAREIIGKLHANGFMLKGEIE